ncbi:hypothetical protein J3A78_003521 [Streptomyces sp. PvR006]|uniref:hypothetical protein n=1 Tax=Streptomyces sp. PvR006 TaxID=2817860 RepID=UPI001AE20981|nr:hypothetical protein [Streptomyces sp. PvR006]MBP2583043.1 hypothetical protein [Streptomyces sp. PvR006]
MSTPPDRPPIEPLPDGPLLPVASPVDAPPPPGETPPEAIPPEQESDAPAAA